MFRSEGRVRRLAWNLRHVTRVLGVVWATSVIVIATLMALFGRPMSPDSAYDLALATLVVSVALALWRTLASGVHVGSESVRVNDFFVRRTIPRHDITSMSDQFSGIVFDVVVVLRLTSRRGQATVPILALPWSSVGELSALLPEVPVREADS